MAVPNKKNYLIRRWRNQTGEGLRIFDFKPIPKEIECHCGCGDVIMSYDNRGRKRIYKLNHSSKIVMQDPDVRDIICKSQIGKKFSEETKKKQSESKKRFYAKHGNILGMYGKKHSEESNEKNRISHYMRKSSDGRYENTKPERYLKSILTLNGINYDSQKSLYGKPDVFIEPNICIFVDGNYWHNLPDKKLRDKRVNEKLLSENFKVLRFWESEIYDNLNNVFSRIKMEVS